MALASVRTASLLALAALLALAGVAQAEGELAQAESLRAGGRYQEAVPLYETVLEADPENLDALYGLGFCLTEIGKKEAYGDSLWAARAKLEQLTALAPGNPDYRYLNGYSAWLLAPASPSYAMVLRQLAEKEMLASIEKRPRHADSWICLARVRRDLGDLDGSIEAFRKTVLVDPDRLEAYPELALLLYHQGRFDEVVDTMAALLEKAPGYHYARKITGDAHVGAGDFDAAEAEYLLGANAEPQNPVWADSLYLLFQKASDDERAVRVFGSLAEKHPGAEGFRKYLAMALEVLGRHEEAAAQYEILVERFPDRSWYHLWLAQARERFGDETGAIASWLEALRLQPDFSNAFMPLRERYEKLKAEGRYAEAAKLMRRVADCEPIPEIHKWVQWEISECSRQIGDIEGTFNALHMAIQLDPMEPRFSNSLGLYFRALGRFDEAIAEFHRALEKRPGYLYTIENLAATFQMSHRYDEARKWLALGFEEARRQHAYAADMEERSEREFDVFKFPYFLHELETLEDRKTETEGESR